MKCTDPRGHSLELFQFEEIRVGFVLGEADLERRAQLLVLGHGRGTRVPARRLRHSLQFTRRGGVFRPCGHFKTGHGAVDTIHNCPNGRRRSIRPPVRILLILILLSTEVLELLNVLLPVLLFRGRVVDPHVVLGLAEERLLVGGVDAGLCSHLVHQLVVLVIRHCSWFDLMGAPLGSHC